MQQYYNGETIEFEKPTIVLASASPRRARYLTSAGIKFIQMVSTVDDTEINYDFPHDNITGKMEKEYAKEMALAKLQPFIGNIKNGAVVTADTSVLCAGRILEKPITKEKCREQHEFLSGKKNSCYTAVAVYYNGKVACKVKVSKVKFKPIPPEVIERICNEPEVLDCAGYRLAGEIRNYTKFKGKAHKNNVKGLDPKVVLRLLKKLKFPLINVF
jgi:septum formation protein